MYDLHERIKVRAYYIHIETGKSSQECWLQAEKIEKKLVKYDGNLKTMSKSNVNDEKLKKDKKDLKNMILKCFLKRFISFLKGCLKGSYPFLLRPF